MDYQKLSESLAKLVGGIEERDIAGLRKLGSELGEVALVENEKTFVEIAATAYCIAKLLEKPHFAQETAWKNALPKILESAREALDAAENGRSASARKKIASANSELEKAGSAAGRFQMGVLEKARIKIGADIYAHGASLGRACELSGAAKEKLQPYLGNTKLPDKYQTMPAGERLAKLAQLFA